MLPLPVPERGGSIEALQSFLNLSNQNDFVLVVAWLLAALRSSGPYPLLAISGEQGSTKTVLSKLLRALVDPNVAPVRALPREERELMIAANNGHLLAFDNLSGLPAWLSDALCRLASGGSFAVRARSHASIFERPTDEQDHYTERLVRLPNLSIYYEPLEIRAVPVNRAELGLRPNNKSSVYWCGQTIKKFLPQFDSVFPRVAREAGDCQFVFIRSGHAAIDELFGRRLDAAFASFGLRARDYCVALAPMDTLRYVAAIGECDIFLDCIGWSGCNSTLESLPHDLPIVTLAGPLMRGRHSKATETIAGTVEAYVSTAVRLTRDRPWRSAVRRRMSQYKHRVYRDNTAVEGLAEFLDRVARGQPWKEPR